MRITTALLFITCLCVTAQAQDISSGASSALLPGICVIGSATVKLKPSIIEINASLSAEAELANDARVKERDARALVADALQAKVPGVVLESRGISVNPLIDPAVQAALQRQQQIMIQNGVIVQVPSNQSDAVRRIGVSEQLRLVLKDADKLETPQLVETVLRMIDAGREGGLKFGPDTSMIGASSAAPAAPVPLLVCKAPDSAAAREQAYKAALDDARQKASKLAEVAGMKIGKIVAVRELEDRPAQEMIVAEKDSDLSSNLLGDIPLNVRLAVQFEIVK